MDIRQAELHVSALSPAEFRAYTRYLDLLALAQAQTSQAPGGQGVGLAASLGADGTVRVDPGIFREFAVERLSVPRLSVVLDVVLGRVSASSSSSLSPGQVYAAFRLLAHARANDWNLPVARADELVFVPVAPLGLDEESIDVGVTRSKGKVTRPPAPPRRSLTISGGASTVTASRVSPPSTVPSTSTRSRPSLPARATHASPSSPPDTPSPTRASSSRARQSLPAAHSLDPFRDTPTSSPAKPRSSSTTRSHYDDAVINTNPFRRGSSPSLITLPSSTSNNLVVSDRPPLPPRKPSIKRPSLPPRRASSHPASSSSSVRSFDVRVAQPVQPTSTSTPSTLMQQSLAAAAAAASESSRTRRDDVVFEVIRRSSPVKATPSPEATGGTAGRRDLIDTVTRAVRESEVEAMPPPPPKRVPSIARKKGQDPPRSSLESAVPAKVERSRSRPGAKAWSVVSLLGGRRTVNDRHSRYAMIILNQPVTRRDTLLRTWQASDLRYCADGGANRLYDALDPEERALMLPTMIKGDLDSLRPEVKAYYAGKGVVIKRDNDQYSTDLMKCVAEVASIEQASGKHFSLLFLGGLSGRLDQTAHTLSILFKMREKRWDTFVLSEDSLAWVLDKGSHVIEIDHTTMGQTCGILPLGVESARVRTEGLEWNLDWVTSLGGDLSTSNHLVPSEPSVYLETDRPVFWTLEIRPGLVVAPPRGHLSTTDELSRGVKELGVGFVRAAGGVAGGMGKEIDRLRGGGVNRRLSRGGGSGVGVMGSGVGAVGVVDGERAGLVSTDEEDEYYQGREHEHGGEAEGYAMLD